MDIDYRRLSENEVSRIVKMRLDQLTEEYVSTGRSVPEDVDLETALVDFYKRNMAAGTYVSWLASIHSDGGITLTPVLFWLPWRSTLISF